MAMSLSLAVTAGAAFNDQDKIVNEEAVDMCVALNIINGRTNGDFDPAGNVTRAEAAKMICIALNGGKEPTLSASATSAFADINGHWAAKYIEYCVSLGIVAGKSATTFDPNGNVTGTELAKMLLIALGYNAEHEKFVGANWDTNVNVVASQKDLYENLESIDPSVALSRDNAAQMIWNALEAFVVEYDYTLVTGPNGELTSQVVVSDKIVGVPGSKITLLDEEYGTTSKTGVLEAAGALTINGTAVGEDKFTVKGITGTFELEGEDLSGLIGQDVKVVYKTDKNNEITVYGVFATAKNTVATGIVDDLSDVTSTTLKLDGKKLKLDSNFAAYAKTGTEGQYASADLSSVANAFAISIIDNDDDGDYDISLIDTKLVAKVMSANNKTFTIKQVGASTANVAYQSATTLKYDYEDADIANPVVYDGMAKDDYVVVSYDAVTGALIVEQAKVIEAAEITTVNSGAFTIDGAVYETATADSATKGLVVGDTASFVVYGNYIYTSYDVNSNVSASDYVVVLGMDNSNQIDGARVKILKADGKTEVVTPKTVTRNAPMTDDETSVALNQYGVYTVKASGEKVKFYAADDAGAFDDILNSTTFAYNSDNNARTTLGGARIADDAVILYLDEDGDPQVMTGETLRGTKTLGTVTNATYANAWSTEASNGVDYVQFAWLGQLSGVKAATDTTVYAYVVDTCGTTKDGDDTVATITIAAGEGESEVLVCNDTFAEGATLPTAGNFIKYEVTTDGKVDIDTVSILTVQSSFTQNQPVAVAITGIEGDSIFATVGTAVADGNWYEFLKDADTQVIYVNVQDQEGGADVGINTAGEDASGYVKNAYVVYEKDGSDRVIKAIFVESDNDINS